MTVPYLCRQNSILFSFTSLSILLSSLTFTACKKRPGLPDSELATISIQELDSDGYDRVEFGLTGKTPNLTGFEPRFFDKGVGVINEQVKAGAYSVKLNYLKGSEVVYSADFCGPDLRNNVEVVLVPGDNWVIINVCDRDEEPIYANVSIVPKLHTKDKDNGSNDEGEDQTDVPADDQSDDQSNPSDVNPI